LGLAEEGIADMTISMTILAASILVLIGVLIGCSLSEKWLDARFRQQTEMQRRLNSEWRDLQAARKEKQVAYLNGAELVRR
jgi:uncharacterized membrane-anchored protein YhcB (DUF1043 family)